MTIDRWEPSTRRLFIKALDLVDGTPIYDVKPYVHWDIPTEVTYDISGLKLPTWVESKDDVLASVTFESNAESALEEMVRRDELSPLLYPKKDPNSCLAAKQTLTEILAQDPRSSHRGLTKNQRGTLSNAETKTKPTISQRENEDASVYRLKFGNATVEFMVADVGAIVKNIFLSKQEEVNQVRHSPRTLSCIRRPCPLLSHFVELLLLLFSLFEGLVLSICGSFGMSSSLTCDLGRRKWRHRQVRHMWGHIEFLLISLLMCSVPSATGFSFSCNRAWQQEVHVVPRPESFRFESSVRRTTYLAMAMSSKDLKKKKKSKPVLGPGKSIEIREAKEKEKKVSTSEKRRSGTNDVVARLARAAKEANEARKRQLEKSDDGIEKEDYSDLNEEKSKKQSKYPSRHKKPKSQTSFYPMEESNGADFGSTSNSSTDQSHLSTISTLNSVIDQELLHPPNGLKPLREVDSLRLLLEHNNLVDEQIVQTKDGHETDDLSSRATLRRNKSKAGRQPAHEAAIIFAKPLIDDQITIEFATRLMSLAKAIKFDSYRPEWICFCPSLCGNIALSGVQKGRSLGHPRNVVPATAAGVIFFRHLCSANDIPLDEIGICQIMDDQPQMLLNTLKDGDSADPEHFFSNTEMPTSWSPAFFHPMIESLVDEGYLDHWLEQSTDFESGTDEYGMTREEPRKKVEIHFTLFSTDHDLCNLNDIHIRSPRQSPMWHLVQDLENMIRQKQKFRRGILHTTWSFRYSVYPYVVYPIDTAASIGIANRNTSVGAADASLMAFLGKCYLMAHELVPLLVNMRGVAENSEFFQRDNYRRLVKTRRSLATLLEQMNEAYRHNREFKSETISISPSLKSQLKEISPNIKGSQFQESLSKSEPNSSTEIQLESALLSLGRCCDLVRPAGTFSADSVNRQEWRDALRHLQDFMRRIKLFCDPDLPLPAKQWGVQILENEPVSRSLSPREQQDEE